jgi:hypothetical protein
MRLGKDGEVVINPPLGPATRRDSEVPPPPGAGGPPAQPTAAEPIRDFVACHDLSAEAFDAWLNKDADGFRLHWLDVQTYRRETRYAAIAVKAVKPGEFKQRHRIPANPPDALNKHIKEMEGYRALWDWLYNDGGQSYHTFLWTKDGQGSVLSLGTALEVREVADRVLRDGFNLSAITPCRQPGTMQYLVSTNSERRPMHYSLDSTREALPAYIEQAAAKGCSLDQLTAYKREASERFVVIVSRNINKPVRTIEWDIPPDKLTERIADQKKKGIMPWCLTACGLRADMRYAVIWCPFDPNEK